MNIYAVGAACAWLVNALIFIWFHLKTRTPSPSLVQKDEVKNPAETDIAKCARCLSEILVILDRTNGPNSTNLRAVMICIDELHITLRKFTASQDKFLKSMFGENTPALSTEEPEEVRKAAERYMRVYGISSEEAIMKAKATLVYGANNAMREDI